MLSKKVVIAGGTGEVGAGLAALMHTQGYEVHIISRNQEKIDKLRSEHPEYFFYCIDCADYSALRMLAEKIGSMGVFISSLGGFVETKNILACEPNFVDAYFKSTLFSHYNLLKYFLPVARNFVVISGEAGLEPMKDYGLVSIFDAAQIMLTKVIGNENPNAKLSQLVICEKVSERDLPISSVYSAIQELIKKQTKLLAIGKNAELAAD